jgi:hypothetical protein
LLVTAAPGQSPVPTIQEQVAKFPRNKTLSVKLKTGETVKGKLLSAGETSFELQQIKGSFLPRRSTVSVPYQEVASVKGALSNREQSAIAVVIVVGGILATLAILCANSYCSQ